MEENVNGEKTWSLWEVKANVSSSGAKRYCYPTCEKQSEEKPLGSGLLVVNTSGLLSLTNIIKKLAVD